MSRSSLVATTCGAGAEGESASRCHHGLAGLATLSFTRDNYVLRFGLSRHPRVAAAFKAWHQLDTGIREAAREVKIKARAIGRHRARRRRSRGHRLASPCQAKPRPSDGRSAATASGDAAEMGDRESVIPKTARSAPIPGLKPWDHVGGVKHRHCYVGRFANSE